MLDGGSLASHSSQHAGRHSSVVSHRKRSRCGCLGRPSTQGSAVSAFNPLAAQQCVLRQQGFSSSVCQVVAGATQTSTSGVYQQCWREWDGWCARQGLPNNAISAPKLAIFFVTFVSGGTGLAYHWYLSFGYFCIFGTSSHSQGIFSYYLKLAWKTATLLALVTAKRCSDLTLLCVDNQHLFCSVMLLFLFHCLVARQIAWVIFPLRFILSLTPMLIFALFFI